MKQTRTIESSKLKVGDVVSTIHHPEQVAVVLRRAEPWGGSFRYWARDKATGTDGWIFLPGGKVRLIYHARSKEAAHRATRRSSANLTGVDVGGTVHEWQGPFGKRWIAHRDGDRLFIRTEGNSPNIMDIIRESDLGNLIRSDESEAQMLTRRRQSASAEVEAQTVKLAEKRGLHGFTASMSAVTARKVEETLDKQQNFSGRFMSRRAFAEEAAESGAVIEFGKEGRRLVFPKGNFYRERDVTKIVLDYVDFLNRRR